MNGSIRRKLDMVRRVYALSLQHQEPIAGLVDAVTRMGERLGRADQLAEQAEAGTLSSEASVARKDEIRRVIREEQVAHIVRIARAALPVDPDLRARFRFPARGLNQQQFVAAVRAILAEAASRKALFIGEGLPETFVEDLEGLLTSYIEALDQKGLGAARRVGAVADLKVVTTELMGLVKRLDGINRKRWQKNRELLAAWISAKDVSWPHGRNGSAADDGGSPTAGKEAAA